MSPRARAARGPAAAVALGATPGERLASLAASPDTCAAVLQSALRACRDGLRVTEALPREAVAGRRGKAFLRLDATLVDPSTRRTQARGFVCEFFADDDGRKVLWRLRRRHHRTDIRPYSGYVAPLRLLVRELPYDYRLETLAAALEPGALSSATAACAGDWETSLTRADVVRYVPEKRCLLRLRSRDRTVLAKIYPRDADLSVAGVQASLFDATRATGPIVPAVVGVLPAFRAVLQEEVRGASVYDRLRAGGCAPAVSVATAEALAALHGVDVPGLRHHGVAEEIDVVDHAIASAPLGERLRPAVTALLAELRRQAPRQEAGPVAFVHRDFYDKQVIVDDGRCVVIDFDTARLSFRELDVANYAAHLALRALQGYLPRAEALAHARAFVQAYSRSGRVLDAARLWWCAASTWLRLTAVYAARPAWPGLPDRLVALAARALDERAAERGEPFCWSC